MKVVGNQTKNRKMRFILTTLLSFVILLSVNSQNAAYENYINRFKDIAISEMERTGIPASIKLAQGLIESNAGRSDIAQRAKNHFGMKCGGSWNGGTYYKKDDDYDRHGNLKKSCFRKYKDANESYVAHSEFLRDPDKQYRYGFLFRLDPTDYKSWAYGLLKAGYATNQRYAKLLIKVIEEYNLYQYDNPQSDVEMVMERSYQPHKKTINDVDYVVAEEGDSPRTLSMDFGVSVNRILKYNEHVYDENQELTAGTRVFLQRKRSGFRGKRKYHYVKEGETMFTIAQKYAIRLNKLYHKNKMDEGTEPAIGERIKLRGWALFSKKPTLRSEKGSILPDAPEKDLQKDEEIDANIEEVEKEFMKEVKENEVSDSTNQKEEYDPYGDRARFHTVKKGDNLYKLSKKYNISVEKIVEMNNLNSNVIKPGQVLRIER